MLCKKFDASKIFIEEFEKLVDTGQLETILYDKMMKERQLMGYENMGRSNLEELVKKEQGR